MTIIWRERGKIISLSRRERSDHMIRVEIKYHDDR
jgi:hypothetical protein